MVRTANEFEYVELGDAVAAIVRGPDSDADGDEALRRCAGGIDVVVGSLFWENNSPFLRGKPLTRTAH